MARRLVAPRGDGARVAGDIADPSSLPDGFREPLPLLGRQEELAVLRQVWEKACTGRHQLVLVTGEPGIGKSRLARELAFEVAAEGGRVLAGGCADGPVVPYQPFVAALRAFLDEAPDELRRSVVQPHAAQLGRLLPELAATGGEPQGPQRVRRRGRGSEDERGALFDGFAAFLDELASRAPVVMVLDDLQWADRASLLLLTHLQRRRHPIPLLLIGTYRETPVERGHPMADLLELTSADRSCQRLPLGGLPTDTVATLLRGQIQVQGTRPMGQTLSRAIWRATGGNPFVLSQVIALLAESGDPELGAFNGFGGRPLWRSQGPDEVLSARVSSLDVDTRRALEAAGVAGRQFFLDEVAAMLGSKEAPAGSWPGRAAESGLVERSLGPARYAFTHDLVRQWFYDRLPGSRRVRLHAKLAKVLSRRATDDPEATATLAFHLAAASPVGGSEEAAHAAARAGQAALGTLAYEDATEHFGRALALLPRRRGVSPGMRADLLVALGDAHRRTGDSGRARQAFLEAVGIANAAADRERLASAALAMARLSPVWGADDELTKVLETALGVVGNAGPRGEELAARLRGARRTDGDGAGGNGEAPLAQTAALSDPALEMARRTGDSAAVAAMLRARHIVLWRPEQLDDRTQAADEVVALARSLGDEELALHGHRWRAVDGLERGQLAEADEHIAAHASLATRLGGSGYRRDVAGLAAMRALLDGRVDVVRKLVHRVSALGADAGEPPTAVLPLRLAVAMEWGSEHELAAVVDACLDAGGARVAAAWRASCALGLARLDDPEQAAEVADVLWRRNLGGLPEDSTRVGVMADLAEVIALAEDADRAERLYPLLAPYRERVIVTDGGWGCRGAASRLLGLLAATCGRWQQADGHFTAAAELHRRLGARPLLARTHHDQAVAWLERGRPTDLRAAGVALDQAGAAATELGMVRLLSEVGALSTAL